MKHCLILQWLHEVLAPGYFLWDQLGKLCKKHNNRVGLWRLAWRWKKSDEFTLSETLKALPFYRCRNQVFTHWIFVHTETFTQRSFYTELLHTEAFSRKTPLHRGTFTQRNLYAQTCLHTVAFTHSSSCTEKCLIFHDFSPSVIFISSFSCSFGQLPPPFCFHVARCSVRPRFVLAPSAAKQTKREPRNK